MGVRLLEIVNVALSQKGEKETDLNNIKYNTWYYNRKVWGGLYPYCAVFVSWCAEKAGISSEIIPKTASVKNMYEFFKAKNQFHTAASGYIPNIGDLMLQMYNGANHIGIIVDVDSLGYTSIEGNSGQGIEECRHSFNELETIGYASPEYSTKVFKAVLKSSQPNLLQDNGTVNLGIYNWIDYTVKEGDTLESIAKAYNTTIQLILWGSNLNTQDIVPGMVIQVPASKNTNNTQSTTSDANKPILVHSKQILVSHPTAYVRFYGEYGQLSAVSTSDGVNIDESMDYDIISINTNRTMNQDCPTFSISLVWKNKWYDNLGSNDLVIIQLQRPPEKLQTVFFGLIDDIRKSMDFSSIQPQRSVLVTGRGVNKAFCQFDISPIKQYSDQSGGSGFFAGLMELQGRGSAFNIQTLISAYLDKGLRYKFSNGKTLKDYIGYTGTNYPNEKLINRQSFLSFSGTIWNFIKQLSNSPFNETFWEIKYGCPWLIHRPTPFEKDTWGNLPRVTIKDYDIIANNTGRSDDATFSAFQVELTVEDSAAFRAFPPAYYPPYYDKYGLRMHTVRSMYAITSGSISESKNLDPKIFTQQLANFNIKNNIMENGTITVKGSNQYHIGERIILESDNMEYYVEGVRHSFNMYASWVTSLNVTRGIQPEERFTPPWGMCIDLTNDIFAGIVKLTSGINPDWRSAKEGGTPVVRQRMNQTNQTDTGVTPVTPQPSPNPVAGEYSYQGIEFTHPSPGARIITSGFGPRYSPTYGASSYHKGIDLSCDGGSEGQPILAAADGEVIWAGESSGYGNLIEILHDNGISTRYGHMWSSSIQVSVGQRVVRGQQIASIGAAGIGTGAHLHFELRVGVGKDMGQQGTAIDPQENLGILSAG